MHRQATARHVGERSSSSRLRKTESKSLVRRGDRDGLVVESMNGYLTGNELVLNIQCTVHSQRHDSCDSFSSVVRFLVQFGKARKGA